MLGGRRVKKNLVAGARLAAYARLPGRLASRGIVIEALEDEQNRTAACWQRFCDLYNAARQGWPDPDPGPVDALAPQEFQHLYRRYEADAGTGRGLEERQRTPFDPKGRKQYAGAVAGPAFTKRSPTQLGEAIDQAVQEAPDAIANQPVSRDDKDAVKEFYRDRKR